MEKNDRLEEFCKSMTQGNCTNQKKRRELREFLEKMVEEELEQPDSNMDTDLIDCCVEIILWLAGIERHDKLYNRVPADEAEAEEIRQAGATYRRRVSGKD